MTQAVPADNRPTAQMILHSLHHAFGRGCGALIGGAIINTYGIKSDPHGHGRHSSDFFKFTTERSFTSSPSPFSPFFPFSLYHPLYFTRSSRPFFPYLPLPSGFTPKGFEGEL